LYYFDNVYRYGDPNLTIPYFIEQELRGRNREQFSDYINAIFGFHFEIRHVIGCLLHHYRTHEFPSSIVDFLKDLKIYLKEHPYSEEFTQSSIKSIEKAIGLIQENPILERKLWIPLELKLFLFFFKMF